MDFTKLFSNKKNAGVLSAQVILKRNVAEDQQQSDNAMSILNKMTHIRLDREGITEIDNLMILGCCVTNLYLQQNYITKIENLQSMVNLNFLTLSNNQIQEINGLQFLKKLKFLDLSNNCIEDYVANELPKALVILNLTNNNCCDHPNHRERLIAHLPCLRTLDNVDLILDDSSSSENDESAQEEEPLNNEHQIHYSKIRGQHVSQCSRKIGELYNIADCIRERTQDRILSHYKCHSSEINSIHSMDRKQALQKLGI